MAPSSSCDQNKSYTYDVFLSFRGEDTRKTFVDHLYAALDQHGIGTFKDDEKLEKGRKINDDLLQSIEESRFYVFVFSKRYASSSWCLDELLKIMECHKTNEHTAFPVFYDVDPSEVRKQSGSVGEALAKHTNRNESEVEKWREALKQAANLSGWDVKKTADGHEAKVIKLIVEKISLELRPTDIIFDENLIGMEQRIKDLDSCLEIGSNDVRMIGIKGMGGAGKTTLARVVFDKISINFDGISFVENVRERASQSGLKKLQKQILKDVLKDNSITISGVYEGKRLMKKKLCAKKVLLVLDDVDAKEQLEMLAGDSNWFKKGSRIVITTRDKLVLDAHRVKWIHDVNLLSNEEAMRLLSRHAFGKDIPTQGYKRHSCEVVDYAAGLPLTVKVLGSDLCGKDGSVWRDVLERLKTIPLNKTLKILEISYDNLEDEHKEMFLNVACFLRDWEKDEAIRMLESCGFYAKIGLRVLEQKSLIVFRKTIDGSLYIHMHDHLVEMGKNIVRREHQFDPRKHSRLWVKEEIEHVLANDLVNEATRYIDLCTTDTVFERIRNLKGLRCLIVNHIKHNSLFEELIVLKIDKPPYLPNSLQYLYWSSYPYWCLPKTLEANNLVALEMINNNLKQLWEGGKVMKQLKFLDLSGSNYLSSLDLGLVPNLEYLNVEACFSLVNLYLHDGKVMNKLKVLSLGFTKIRSLDLGLMPNLEKLLLPFCDRLVELYMHGGCLKSLVFLNLKGCKNLESLMFIEQLELLEVLYTSRLSSRQSPDYIITWHSENSLLELHISDSDIEELPSSVGNLHNLVSLVVYLCHSLKCLPGSICTLQHLKTLSLRTTGIEELPDDFGQLECLEMLNLTQSKVRHLPRSFFMLKCLKTLLLQDCYFLEKLPKDVGQLESLVEINLKGCKNLRDIPNSICKLNRLKELNLEGCRMLEKLPDDMGDLECLQKLDIQNTIIVHLPPNISFLKGLKIYRSELDDFIRLCFEYDTENNKIQGFQHLRILDLERCGIKELPESLGHLECLEELNLSYTDIKHLPDSICMLKHLKNLVLQRCVLLEKLPNDVHQLESLEELYLSRCYTIREFPNSFCALKQLKVLDLYHCFSLEKLPVDVGQLECLEKLDLSRCYNIREIPDSICMLKHIKKLKLEGCRRLEKLPDELGVLECLQELTIWDTAISHLPQSIYLLNDLKISSLEPNHNDSSEDRLLLDDFDLSCKW